MPKGRSTTYEERIALVKERIENGCNYGEITEKCKVGDRVYPKFETYLLECHEIDPRNREIIQKRLQGITLETVA